MATLPSSNEHIVLAARARGRMREETSEIARAILLRVARFHEAMVGRTPRGGMNLNRN